MDRLALLAALPLMLLSPGLEAVAQTDKYQVTAAEHAACDVDARRLCGSSATEDALVACMRQQRSNLSEGCRLAFDSGLKKRGLQ